MKKSDGSILITTSWILAILSLLSSGVGFRAGIETRLTQNYRDTVKARYMAIAGIVKAQALLKNDLSLTDTLYECGIQLKDTETLKSLFHEEGGLWEGSSFTVSYPFKNLDGKWSIIYGMMDEDRKININLDHKTGATFMDLKKILMRLSPRLNEEIINSIMDWQDSDSAISQPGGAENGFYTSLDHPYVCKNAPFEYIEELLMVRGMNQEIFNEIKDFVTVLSDGKININTTPREVLAAIIATESNLYEEMIDKIIVYRRGPDGIEGSRDDGIFMDFKNVQSKLGLETAEVARLGVLSNYFTFKANTFLIRSEGSAGHVKKIVTCVVGRTNTKGQEPMKLYLEE